MRGHTYSSVSHKDIISRYHTPSIIWSRPNVQYEISYIFIPQLIFRLSYSMAGYHLAKTQDFSLESAHSLIVRIAIHGNISMWKRNKTQIYPVDVVDIFSLFWAWPTETAQNKLNISTGIESMSNPQVPLSYTIAERKLCILILDDAKTANSVRPSIIINRDSWR